METPNVAPAAPVLCEESLRSFNEMVVIFLPQQKQRDFAP